MTLQNNQKILGADMSRFTSVFKQIAHGLSLTLLCVISLVILIMVGIIKEVDLLWRCLTSSAKRPAKQQAVEQLPHLLTQEEAVEALLSADDVTEASHLQSAEFVPAEEGHTRLSEERMVAIERYQSMPPRYDDFDDELYDEDEFLAEPEVAKPLITIEILRRDEAPEPNMPSSFFPGCGSDGARFQVIGDDKPDESDLCTALYRWANDACLVNYDQETGIGYFRIVDGEAPEKGSVIDLE
jgi:hypothetical protein